MKVKINGRDEDVGATQCLISLIDGMQLDQDKIVIEYNGRIVPRDEWPVVALNNDDRIEIVSFVGGG